MTKTRKSRSLVTKKLEMVSVEVFKQHNELIIDLVGDSPGVYALYDGSELYYVGKSIDLKKRVKQHLKDRHKASWTHFSLYLVRNAEHIAEIESLLVRISNPRGNRVTPQGSSSESMLKKLQSMVKAKHKEQYNRMFDINHKVRLARSNSKRKIKQVNSLVGLVTKNTELFKNYKGKDYKAILTPAGKIKFKNKLYDSPTAAAVNIVDRIAVNGWKFWFVKDNDGNWVLLDTLRG